MSTKITNFDSKVCKVVADRMEKALADLGAELGVVIRVRGGNFTAGSYVAKVELAVQNTDGTVSTREAEEFKKYAHLFGLKPEHLNQSVVLRGETYTVVGLRAGASKYPILCKNSRGRAMCLKSSDVAAAFEKQSATATAHMG